MNDGLEQAPPKMESPTDDDATSMHRVCSMTSDPHHTGEKPSVSIREWMSFGIAFTALAGTAFYSYFNGQADNHVTASQVTVLTSQMRDLSTAVADVSHKLSDMPRPSDYQDIQSHLSRVDNAFGAVGDRFNRDEVSAAETATKVQRLMDGSSAPLRTPR